MKAQQGRTETAKKEYKKPVLNEFGRVADLTTGGSTGKMENNGHPDGGRV